jgi:hypothetical protein
VTTFTRLQAGSPLFVPPALAGAPLRVSYLLPTSVTAPDSLSVSDALYTYPGTFLLSTPVDDTALPAFIAAARAFLANRARAGAVVAWLAWPDDPAAGLTGWIVMASRAGRSVVISRPALIEFANFTISLAMGTTIAPSNDGNGLTLAAAAGRNALAVTPFGARQAVALPITGDVTLPLLAPGPTRGCLGFGLTMDAAAELALDVGLRAFSAPLGGGYAETARLPVFAMADITGGIPLSVTMDPLAPLDATRTLMSLAPGVALASNYRTPVGGRYTLTPSAGAALVFSTRLTGVDAQGGSTTTPANTPLYLVPSGTFALTATPSAPGNLSGTLMAGLSGVEYLTVTVGATLTFVPGQAAFAPTLGDAAASGGTRVFGPLTGAATTSWGLLTVPGGTSYYAQPDSAVLYQPGTAGSPFLKYLPLKIGSMGAAHLSDVGTSPPGYPLMPYAGTPVPTGMSLDDVAQFELQAWAPARRAAIRALVGAGVHADADPTDDPPLPSYGTSAQGLLLDFGDGGAWSALTVGASSATGQSADQLGRQQQLLLKGVKGDLRDALQTNQLFLVATAGDLFQACASVPYTLTSERLDLLGAMGEDACVIARLEPLVHTTWPDAKSLLDQLAIVLTPAQYAAELASAMIRKCTADFSLFVAGWEFDLSPWRWADHKSILLFKFCTKKLSQLALDTSQWASAPSFNAASGAVQQQMAAFFADAVARYDDGKGDTDFAYFVNTVLSDPEWNGILVLDATVPLSGLPAQMEGIAAGIDPAKFRAHHVGINVTPVQPAAKDPAAKPSSVFALIDYEDPAPLVSSDNYQFKVNSLKVLIANSGIAAFSSRIELLINALFGEAVTQLGAPDNNLHFSGYYQRSGGVGSYRFVTDAASSYAVASAVLYKVAIASASFVTVTDLKPDSTTCHSYFGLVGTVSFLPQPGFDAWSYGPEQQDIAKGQGEAGLHFSDLCVNMTFDVATPSYKTFAFDLSKVVADTAQSAVRAKSLAAHFPMKLTSLYQGLGAATPDTLGFMPVDSPLTGSEVSAPWFGLRYDLDLGSPGALAADVGFTAGLLLAWAPNSTTPTVYVGLSLPGVSGGQRAISLEGILSLTFADVLFIVQAPTYMLQLGNIAIKLFMLTFPPNGQVNLLLFGNPDAQTSGALGWYASYVKNGAGGGGGAAHVTTAKTGLLAAP